MAHQVYIVNTEQGVTVDALRQMNDNAVEGKAELIFDGRNKLWHVKPAIVASRKSVEDDSANEDGFVVKKFKSSLKTKLVYSIFSSKARRSYEHAVALLSRGIHTPMPCGYIEHRGAFNALQQAVYVCHYDDSGTLGEYLDKEGRKGLEEFARFIARVHSLGIRHDDLNRTNVRVKRMPDGTPEFSLIDLNRMKVYEPGKEVPLKESLKNLCRFSDYDDDFVYFVENYLRERGLDKEYLALASKIKLRHNRRTDMKKSIKKPIKKFFSDIKRSRKD